MGKKIFFKIFNFWIICIFIVNFNKISSYLIEKKIINILSIIFTLFFINSLSSKVSDLDILNKESKFLENSILIGPKTLKENGNFVNYSKFLKTYLYDYNAKNKYFFNEKDAPLVFGISGNLEILQNRRYEYLSKYHTKKNYSKFIMSDSGMYKDIKYYCSKFRSNTHYFNFKNYEYEKCNRIKK